MTNLVLDLNDADLRIARDGQVVASATGFALIEDKQVLLGDAALRQFRLHPRQANNLFWHRLNTEALAHRSGNIGSHADLVFRQLQHLSETAKISSSDDLIIAVPAATTTDQLGLLLGITEQLGLTVSGLVDSAVAASADQEVPRQFRFVDVSLHRLSVTELSGGDDLRRTGWQDVAELSLSALLDAWVNVIADRFVRETRFDPLANAITEQQVYNQVFDWLTDGARAQELGIEVHNGAIHRRIDLSTSVLVDKAVSRYRLADKAVDGAPLLLSHRAAALPGFMDALRARADSVVACPAGAVFGGISRNVDAIRSTGDGVRFVTRLPSRGLKETHTSATPAPTHILFEGRAVAIGGGLTLTRRQFAGLPSTFPDGAVALSRTTAGVTLSLAAGTAVALDGLPATDGTELRCGSTIEVSGARFTLIEVGNGA